MKKLLPWLSVGVGCLFAIGIAPGCGSDEIAGATGGAATTTTGGSGNSLGGAGNKSGGAANTGGASGPGQGNINVMLGARCANDAACGTGLKCLTSDSGAISGGGPAGGICTADCTVDTSVCQKLSANGLCVGDNTSAFCYEACLGGTPSATEVKCHDRAEMACVSLGAQGPSACLPQCNGGQGECRAGTSCDFSAAVETSGLCRATAPVGLATGAKCDPAANAVDPCRGLCVPFSQTVGACGDGCTVGASDACNPAGSTKLEGFCLPGSSTDGFGDAGLCTKLCDCTADCAHADMKCFGNANVEAALGRKGICDLQRADDTAALTASIIETCGAGGAGGAGGVPSTGGATGTGGATSTGGAPSAGGAPSGGGGGGGAGPT